MYADSLISARKIRQAIESSDDIVNAFDGITYAKGGSVLEMFESWMGEKQFAAGLSRYMRIPIRMDRLGICWAPLRKSWQRKQHGANLRRKQRPCAVRVVSSPER